MADLGKQRRGTEFRKGITPHPKSAAVAETAFDPREMVVRFRTRSVPVAEYVI